VGDAHHARFGRVHQRFEASEVTAMRAERDQRIEDLTKELDRLRKEATISRKLR